MSEVTDTPAPVGGLNSRDSLALMPPTDAIELTNWFPGTTSINVRGGSRQHAYGLASNITCMMVYSGVKLFAATAISIYDVTPAGEVGAPVFTGQTSGFYDYVNFAGANGDFLVAVNGDGYPLLYNGSAWSINSPPITGVDSSHFNQVCVWKNRLFFVEEGTLTCWYLGVDAVGGVASPIYFGGLCQLGGTLKMMVTISSSAGNEINDYLCAITSEGECLVFRGTDPSDPDAFSLSGVYTLGRPVGFGSYGEAKLSSDVLILTEDGITTLQAALNNDVVAANITITDKIKPTLAGYIQRFSAGQSWQLMIAPGLNKLVLNVPSVPAVQFVMNTISKSWCKYEGLDTSFYEYVGGKLYGAIGASVYEVDVPGINDLLPYLDGPGVPITAALKTAYLRTQNSQYKMVKPILDATGEVGISIGVGVDFQDPAIFPVNLTLSASAAGIWEVSLWDVGLWGGGAISYRQWMSVCGVGQGVSLGLTVVSDNEAVNFSQWSMILEQSSSVW